MKNTSHPPRDNMDHLLNWLLAGFEGLDPEGEQIFFDAPGAGSIDQSEQVVELPWALSLYHRESKVLDVGVSYLEPWYREALYQMGAADLVGLDLRQGSRDWSLLQQPYLPLNTEQFSLVVCLSHLTQLGTYQGELWAIREFYRLLMPGGRLLLSLPLGAGYYSQRQWLQIITCQPFEVLTLRYFYHNEGWLECYPDQACQELDVGRVQGLGCVELRKGE
ncbi:methyltransferase domain-containing protein [Anthocerotibacter panamensis]|uniref:class I SAM-dependent methyltransferase n=1 Tax=Anthocerotibacter panamensis TaxID=2857077 RepID=UPI001C402FAF|nr:class I SAM-dependent methyltransferase [Anthocerotibacter panamensis]